MSTMISQVPQSISSLQTQIGRLAADTQQQASQASLLASTMQAVGSNQATGLAAQLAALTQMMQATASAAAQSRAAFTQAEILALAFAVLAPMAVHKRDEVRHLQVLFANARPDHITQLRISQTVHQITSGLAALQAKANNAQTMDAQLAAIQKLAGSSGAPNMRQSVNSISDRSSR
jgi:hypothetical protein